MNKKRARFLFTFIFCEIFRIFSENFTKNHIKVVKYDPVGPGLGWSWNGMMSETGWERELQDWEYSFSDLSPKTFFTYIKKFSKLFCMSY